MPCNLSLSLGTEIGDFFLGAKFEQKQLLHREDFDFGAIDKYDVDALQQSY